MREKMRRERMVSERMVEGENKGENSEGEW